MNFCKYIVLSAQPAPYAGPCVWGKLVDNNKNEFLNETQEITIFLIFNEKYNWRKVTGKVTGELYTLNFFLVFQFFSFLVFYFYLWFREFKMYLKLFIVMGISWIMELISWSISIDLVPAAVWYLSDITNALQGVIIFIIFVCRKKIKYLLLKRFGGQICGLFCKIPVNNNSIMSSTSTETSRMSMQAINSFN
ncbi:hypothetical protein PUN28_010880 [Cardiocondyla obscurior]|uniref:7TM GPCR serpentine receptor class x (Srx) domain-containing protein n=1 Tax=Cardiocondyla obscurior TaxID=286306 RepID=A0AAW2FKF3_9HYME